MADTALAPTPATAPLRASNPKRGPATPTGRALRVIALGYVGVLVLVPVVAVVYSTFKPGLQHLVDVLSQDEAVHAFKVSAVVAAASVLVDVVFGIGAAVLLARYRFPGKRLFSAFIDLPIAVSPIVVGLALVLVYGPQGWFGGSLTDTSLQIINAKPGMVLATVFVSLPLVVRAVEPVLQQAGLEQEQAAASLGANAWQRFWRITLPTIRVALAYGTVLAIARCLGEYGAVLVVSGNIAGATQTAPLYIGSLVDAEQSLPAAYGVAFVLVLVALVAIGLSALIRRRLERT